MHWHLRRCYSCMQPTGCRSRLNIVSWRQIFGLFIRQAWKLRFLLLQKESALRTGTRRAAFACLKHFMKIAWAKCRLSRKQLRLFFEISTSQNGLKRARCKSQNDPAIYNWEKRFLPKMIRKKCGAPKSLRTWFKSGRLFVSSAFSHIRRQQLIPGGAQPNSSEPPFFCYSPLIVFFITALLEIEIAVFRGFFSLLTISYCENFAHKFVIKICRKMVLVHSLSDKNVVSAVFDHISLKISKNIITMKWKLLNQY